MPPAEVSRPLAGREQELTRLLDAVAAAHAGRPTVVLLEGEAGLGKSRLVDELLARLPTDAPVATVVARGVDLEGGSIAYGVASDLLRDLVAQAGLHSIRDLEPRMAAALAALDPRLSGGEPTGALDRLALVAGFRTLLAELGRRATVCLVVEDLHWADDSSLDLLSTIAATPPTGRFLVVATLRPVVGEGSGVASHVAELIGRARAQVVTLAPLADTEVAAYLAALGPQAPTPDAAAVLTSLAQGVPLFLEALLSEADHLGERLPTTVAALVSSRVGRLAAPSRRLLEVAAVHAVPVDLGALLEVTGLDETELGTALDDVVRRHLVDAVGGGRYRLHHALVRRSIDEGLGVVARREGHERWARRLARLGGTDPAHTTAVAHHWYHAGRPAQAIVAAVAAAAAAARLEATAEAALHWARVRELWSEVDGPDDLTGLSRDDVVVSLYQALSAAGELAGCQRLVGVELMTHPRPEGVQLGWLEVRRYLHPLGVDDGHPAAVVGARSWPDLVTLSVRVLRRLEVERPSLALLSLLVTLLNRALPDELDAAVGRVLEGLAQLVEDDDPLAPQVLQARAYWFAARGRHEESLRLGLRVEEMVDVVAPRIRHRASADVVASLTDLGRFHEAVTHGEEALRRLGPVETARAPWLALAQSIVLAQLHAGGWARSRQLYSAFLEHQDWFRIGEAAAAMALVAAWQGRPDEARHWIDLGAADLPEINHPSEPATYTFPTHLAEACLAATVGQRAAAREHLRPLLLGGGGPGEVGLLWQVVVEASHLARVPGESDRQQQEWAELVRAAAARVDQHGGLGSAWGADVEASLVDAVDPGRWLEVADAWASVGVPHREAGARVRRAHTLLSRDRESARVELVAARDLLVPLGAAPALLDVQRVAGRGRFRLGVASSGTPHAPVKVGREGGVAALDGALASLTERELDVARLVAVGRTNQQVATLLFMSPKTASVHVSRIILKLGVQNRTEVAAVLHRHGLVEG